MTRMKSQFGVVMAIRKLHTIESPRRVVIVKVGKPRKEKGSNWTCPYQINGLSVRKIQYAHGIDAIQALFMALEGIRTVLDGSGSQLSWAGGEPGDTGFVRCVPTFFGRDFSEKIHRLIDREVQRFAHMAEAKHRKRAGRS